MKEINALQNISVAFEESKGLLKNANLINTGTHTDALEEPTSFIKSIFGIWLYSEGIALAKFPWFSEILELHQRSYQTYLKLYRFTQDSSNSNRDETIKEHYANLEKIVNKYHDVLNIAKNDFSETDDVKIEPPQKKENLKKAPDAQDEKIKEEQKQLKSETSETKDLTPLNNKNDAKKKSDQQNNEVKQNKTIKKPTVELFDRKTKSKTELLLERLNAENLKNNKIKLQEEVEEKQKEESVKINTISKEHLEVCKKLEEETEKQFVLKKELIEQELEQITQRKRLFTKAVNQLTHHCALKKQETRFASSKYKALTTENITQQDTKNTELKEIEKKRASTQKEFEAMEVASIKFEEISEKEHLKEKEKLQNLDTQHQAAQKDLNNLNRRQNRRKQKVEQLKKQLLQAEKDLDGLVDDELKKLDDIKTITKNKVKSQNDIENGLIKQQQARDHNLQLEELKYQDLKQLKKQYYSIQQSILRLGHDHQNLKQGRQDAEKLKKKEWDQLQSQRKIKQELLDSLNSDHQQKSTELNKVIKQHSSQNHNLSELHILEAEVII